MRPRIPSKIIVMMIEITIRQLELDSSSSVFLKKPKPEAITKSAINTINQICIFIMSRE